MKTAALRIAVAALLIAAGTSAVFAAPQPDGGLTSDMVSKLRAGYDKEGKNPAIFNALTANDINNLAVNRDKLIKYNTIFSKEIKAGDITNQEASGRCWMFAGLNTLRPTVVNKLSLGTFKLSTNYLFFYDKLEKANTFLQEMIRLADRDLNDREVVILLRDPCPDGGWWSYVVDLVNKYGVVPQEIMPETYATSHTGTFNGILYRKLRQDAAALRDMFQAGKSKAQLEPEKEKMLGDVYKIIALNFGEPPATFTWRYVGKDSLATAAKQYTPLSYYQEVIGIPISDMVCIFNYPGQDYYKLYRIEDSRNLYDKENLTFINLPIDSLKRYALTEVLNNDPVWFACDVGKNQYGLDGKGILTSDIYDYNSVYGMNVGLTKEQRIKYRDSSPNHAMVLTGVDTANGQALKWKVENSWGTTRGDSGWWTMYDDWFNDYVYIVIVDKKYLPKEVTDILQTTPTVLPAWDPMYDFARGITHEE